jgi:hypothetical protein
MIMNMRITEPNPQHMQSRKESEKGLLRLRAMASGPAVGGPLQATDELEPSVAGANLFETRQRALAGGVGG